MSAPTHTVPTLHLEELWQRAQSALSSGDLDEAADLCRQGLAEGPENTAFHYGLGIALLRGGLDEEAEEHFRKVLEREPDFYDALNWLSSLTCRNGRTEEAIELCNRAIASDPSRPEAYLSRGLANLILRRYQAAADDLGRTYQVGPEVAQVYYQLGYACRMARDLEGAAQALEKAIGLEPGIAAYRLELGRVEQERDRVLAAIQRADEALGIDPRSADAFNLKAQALAALGRNAEAEQCMHAALGHDGDSAEAYLNLGMHLQFKGDFDGAARHLERAIDLQEALGAAYHSLAQLQKFASPSDRLIRVMTTLVSCEDLNPVDAAPIHYALGKAFEDLADYEMAMHHYDEANRFALLLKRGSWDEIAEERILLRMTHAYSREFIKRYAKLGEGSELPVLIVGMIRSGTTLTEQILSSHPEVAAAGEQTFWIQQYPKRDRGNRDRTSGCLEQIADGYLGLLRGFDAHAQRVTDKYPNNYELIGPILCHLPNARIIHVRRDPVDTCLSIWKTRFSRSPSFTHRREHIVSAYRQYLRYMDHWRSVVPPDRLLEIDYEELVVDPEGVSRRMVAFCGLEWHPACLRPEQNQRSVSTPSLWRIRQRVDRTSVEKWRTFEPWLGSFRQLMAEPS